MRGRTLCSRSGAPHRGCWSPLTPVAPHSGEHVGLPPPPMWWCSRPLSHWPGDPPRGSSTAARNEPLPPEDSIENLAKVSGHFSRSILNRFATIRDWKDLVDRNERIELSRVYTKAMATCNTGRTCVDGLRTKGPPINYSFSRFFKCVSCSQSVHTGSSCIAHCIACCTALV